MNWLRLIRWKNLLIVFLTQLLVWRFVILPEKDSFGYTVHLLLNFQNFLCLSLSTVLIAAAGYIINDYFDIKIDIINRPGKVVLEKAIPLKTAIIAHSSLNLVGLLLAAYVARQAHHYEWLSLQILCSVLLWFYSTHFKRQFLIGNVVVAILTALTIVVLLIYEPIMHYYTHIPMFPESSETPLGAIPLWIIIIYSCFAFMLTWMREIVKDMEDYKGDAEDGCITMPIKWGLKRSANFAILLGALTILPLICGAAILFFENYVILGAYIAVALVLPLFAWCIQLWKATTTDQYAKSSRNLKIIMLFGICSVLVYNFDKFWP